MNGFNEQFLISIVIIAIGYVLKRFNLVKEKDGEGIARIVFNLTLPCLIIVTFSDVDFSASLFYLVIIAFIYGVINAVLALMVFRNHPQDIKGTFGMMVPGLNTIRLTINQIKIKLIIIVMLDAVPTSR